MAPAAREVLMYAREAALELQASASANRSSAGSTLVISTVHLALILLQARPAPANVCCALQSCPCRTAAAG
jgi:hypothetical protein